MKKIGIVILGVTVASALSAGSFGESFGGSFLGSTLSNVITHPSQKSETRVIHERRGGDDSGAYEEARRARREAQQAHDDLRRVTRKFDEVIEELRREIKKLNNRLDEMGKRSGKGGSWLGG